ncbi:MAG: class I SAM-dependent methyltransferase, partial [Pseudomonadota bacterium]|nr:class I SAM-dependent methyltransferase [Pseudomonadota bacterium]
MQTIQLEKLNVKEGHKVLDLGCGHGRHCHAVYYHKDCQIIGVDLGFEDILITR